MALVCSLGSLSFGAYEEPNITGLDEVTVSGTRLRHLHYQTLSDGVDGVLKIHLESAQNVPNYDFMGGKSDPYVLFSTGWSQVASETKKDDDSPVWNSNHYLLLRKPGVVKRDMEELAICLYNSNSFRCNNEERTFRRSFRRDDLVGKATLNMADLKQPGIHRHELTLDLGRRRSRVKPTIAFSVQFMTFKDACSEMGKAEESEAWSAAESVNGTDRNQEASTCARSRWTELSRFSNSEHLHFEPMAFLNGVKTGTQAWVHVNVEQKVVAVSFRGTETKRPKDLLTDMNIIRSRFTWRKLPECDLKLTDAALKKSVKVHSGFLNAYRSVWSPILTMVNHLTGWSKEWTVCVTGHSLGGALATLCAFEFANRLDANGLSPHIIMMNFGAPRVGNKEFVRAYHTSVPESYRIVNTLDPVSKVPRSFRHVHHEIAFHEDGDIVYDKLQSVRSDMCSRYDRNDFCNETDATTSLQDPGPSEAKTAKKAKKRELFPKSLCFQGHFETYYYSIVSGATMLKPESPRHTT